MQVVKNNVWRVPLQPENEPRWSPTRVATFERTRSSSIRAAIVVSSS